MDISKTKHVKHVRIISYNEAFKNLAKRSNLSIGTFKTFPLNIPTSKKIRFVLKPRLKPCKTGNK